MENRFVIPSKNNVDGWEIENVSKFVKYYKDEIEHGNPKFDWLGFGEVIKSKISYCLEINEKEQSYKWTEIAIVIYDKLSQQYSDSRSFIFEGSAMMLRVNMINLFGVDKNNPILDYTILINCFNKYLNITFEYAVKLNNQYKEMNIDEKEQFRNRHFNEFQTIAFTKCILGIFKSLNCLDKILIPSEIAIWLANYESFCN